MVMGYRPYVDMMCLAKTSASAGGGGGCAAAIIATAPWRWRRGARCEAVVGGGIGLG